MLCISAAQRSSSGAVATLSFDNPSLGLFYIDTYYIKWVKTSLTDSTVYLKPASFPVGVAQSLASLDMMWVQLQAFLKYKRVKK